MSGLLYPDDPKQLGDYRIIGRLGRGGMGIVYLAESRRGERTAVKVINPELAHDAVFRARFRREVESARRVRRFCTAPVLDAQLEGEQLFVVTEFVDGPNLDRFVRQSGPMRGSSLEHLAVGVATALTAIHGAGIIHRDLKPANVLLSSVGPRVIDFGIARALDTISGMTRTGQLIGTPAYTAPELIAGRTASPASDVFAWGCVVAFAGTGRAPFDGAVIPAVLYQISNGEPSLDGLDDGIRHLVTRALDKDPAQRPSAQEMLDLLTGRPHSIITPATHTQPPNGGPDRPQLRSSRTRLIARSISALAVACVVVVGTSVYLKFHGSDGPPGKGIPVYAADFSDTGSGWTTSVGGSSRSTSDNGYFQGQYRIDVAANSSAPYKYARAPLWGNGPNNALISVDAIAAKASPASGQLGLYCRGNDSNSYDFLVRVDGQGAVIRKEGGPWELHELARESSAPGFKKGKPNRLQAACEQVGKDKVHLRFWINEKLAVEAYDSDRPLPDGSTGLMAWAGDSGTGGDLRTTFDNFAVERLVSRKT